MKRERRGPMNLLHGDIVIATDIAFYTHKGAEGKQSQAVGDMLIVNNPHLDGDVQGCSLMPGSVGLCTGLDAGTYRMAKPSDKHYVMTLQEWDRYQPERALRALWNIPFAVQLWLTALSAPFIIEIFK